VRRQAPADHAPAPPRRQLGRRGHLRAVPARPPRWRAGIPRLVARAPAAEQLMNGCFDALRQSRRRIDRNPLAMPIPATRPRLSPTRATDCCDFQDVSMGGTGLEPVTPSLSIWRRRSRPFGSVRLHGFVARNHPSSEHSSEPERPSNLAILATRRAVHQLVLAAARSSKAGRNLDIVNTLPPGKTQDPAPPAARLPEAVSADLDPVSRLS
jgi:hypothetical protein